MKSLDNFECISEGGILSLEELSNKITQLDERISVYSPPSASSYNGNPELLAISISCAIETPEVTQ